MLDCKDVFLLGEDNAFLALLLYDHNLRRRTSVKLEKKYPLKHVVVSGNRHFIYTFF